jgi:prevent-host-death family protein
VKVTIHEAKTHLSRLIEAAIAGEEVIIAKRNKPVVRLVTIGETKPDRSKLFGCLKGYLPGPTLNYLTGARVEVEIAGEFNRRDPRDPLQFEPDAGE